MEGWYKLSIYLTIEKSEYDGRYIEFASAFKPILNTLRPNKAYVTLAIL